MKILQIIPSLGSGGAERFVVDLCNELSHQGEDVCLCIVQNPEESDYGFYLPDLDPSVKFISLQQSKGFSFKNIKLFHQVIQEIKPNVIHGHLGVLLYFYVLKLLNWNAQFFYTIHTLAEKSSPGFLNRGINLFYFGLKLIKTITISNECNKSYKQYYGLSNACMINNGRSALQQSLLFQNIKEEVRKYKKNDSDLVFIHIARFHSQKNQKVLINAFNQLSKEYPNVILLILGDWSHCSEAIELTSQAGENIYIIGTKPNVADYLLLSDAFCLTSLYEGLPISLIEAISCGCVPICTAVGGIVDVVSHGVNGYLSVNTDETSYLNTLKLFLNQPLAISKETLINLYKNNYSISQSAVLHISLYHKNK